jgi:hypothetical protein
MNADSRLCGKTCPGRRAGATKPFCFRRSQDQLGITCQMWTSTNTFLETRGYTATRRSTITMRRSFNHRACQLMTRYAPPKHHSEAQITASSNLGRCLGNSPRRCSGTLNKMTRGPSSRGLTGVGNIQNFSSHSHSTSPLPPSWPRYPPPSILRA